MAIPEAIYGMESHEASEAKVLEVVDELEAAKPGESPGSCTMARGDLTYTRFPCEH